MRRWLRPSCEADVSGVLGGYGECNRGAYVTDSQVISLETERSTVAFVVFGKVRLMAVLFVREILENIDKQGSQSEGTYQRQRLQERKQRQ